jgi:P2 family phage contractile tail tube protein
MASLAFLPMRGVNVFCAGLNVGITNTGAKLPMMSESGESFTFGGVRGAIEIATSMDAVELAFSTKGIQPDILAQFAAGFGIRNTYTVLGALVDEYAADASKRSIPVIATIIGRLSAADVEKYEGGNLAGTEYTIKSVTKYTLKIGSQEVCRFDLQLGGWLDQAGLQADIANTIGLNV